METSNVSNEENDESPVLTLAFAIILLYVVVGAVAFFVAIWTASSLVYGVFALTYLLGFSLSLYLAVVKRSAVSVLVGLLVVPVAIVIVFAGALVRGI